MNRADFFVRRSNASVVINSTIAKQVGSKVRSLVGREIRDHLWILTWSVKSRVTRRLMDHMYNLKLDS